MADRETPVQGADGEDKIELSLEDLDDDERQPAEDGRLVITDDDLADVPEEPPPAVGAAGATAGQAGGGRVYPGLSNAAMAGAMSPEALAAKEKKGGLAAIRRSTTWQNAIAGGVGGFLAWVILEPLVSDRPLVPSPLYDHGVLLGGALGGAAIGGMIGCALGASEGIWSTHARRALIWGAIGLGIGVLGGLIGGYFSEAIFQVLPIAFVGRGIAWLVLGLVVGTGQGIALRAGKKILNGLIGGAIGGFLGGVLFDVIAVVVGLIVSAGGGRDVEVWPSRLIGFMVLGIACGVAIGIVEQLRKQAWLTIVEGPLTGKEFIIYTQITTIGSDPACEITLFKDPSVAPHHAQIEVAGPNYTLRDVAGLGTTYVNGAPVAEHRLRSGDIIQIGSTVIQYADRAFSLEQVPHGSYG